MKKYFLLYLFICFLCIANGQNIGIGTSSPVGGNLHIKQVASTSLSGLRIENAQGDRNVRLWVGTAGAVLDAYTGTDLVVRTEGLNRMYFSNSTGYVAVGTLSPSAPFHVQVPARFSALPSSALNTQVLTLNLSGDVQTRTLPASIWDGDDNTEYTSGTGINIVSTTINNTGDIDASDDLTNSTVFSGAVSGIYNSLSLSMNSVGTNEIADASISTSDINQNGAADGEVLTWDNLAGTWTTAAIPNDADWTYNSGNLFPSVTSKVGIGTAAPSELLEVSGGSTLLSTYFMMRDFSTNEKFVRMISRDSAWMVWQGGLVAGQFNAGTLPAAYKNHGTLLTKGQTALATNIGSVGIGTAFPNNAKLHIKQSIISPLGGLRIENSLGTRDVRLWVGSTGAVLDAYSGTDLLFRTEGNTKMYFQNSTGFVSVGSMLPTAPFHVQVPVRMDAIPSSSTNTTVLTQNANGDVESRALPTDVWDGDANTEYTAGAGIMIDGSNQVINTGDLDAGDDLIQTTMFSGDVAGTYNNLEVSADAITTSEIENATIALEDINQNSANTGQTLVWDGTEWTTGVTAIIEDLDADTKIQVEESPDEDRIRIDLGGAEQFVFNRTTSGYPMLELMNIGYNTFVGRGAGSSVSTGMENTFFGTLAGFRNDVGRYNTFLGSNTAYFNTSGEQNVFVGRSAGYRNTTGSFNIFIGSEAGRFGSYGSSNVLIGRQSGQRMNGTRNVMIGMQTGGNLVNGNFNTFVGPDAGYGRVGAESSNNTFVGAYTGSVIDKGNHHTLVGAWAGSSMENGFSNVVVGMRGLLNNVTGTNNVAVGDSVLMANMSSNNVAIGSKAGYQNNGAANVFLGHQAGYQETGSNKLYIDNDNTTDPLIYGDFATDLLRVGGTLNINNEYSLPTTDGTSGQLLATDGNGLLNWSNPAADTDWTENGTDLYTAATNVGINQAMPTASLEVNGEDGVLFLGDLNAGVIPATGAGVRMMWFPKRAAFRAGYVQGTQWDEMNIGYHSFASGRNNRAAGAYSASFGQNNEIDGLATFGYGTFNKGSTNAGAGLLGGSNNTLNSSGGVVLGNNNRIDVAAGYSAILAGNKDTIQNGQGDTGPIQYYSVIGGGEENMISGGSCFIGAGVLNKIVKTNGVATLKSAIVAGNGNRIVNGNESVIGGGRTNIARASYGAIVSGIGNVLETSGSGSFIGAGGSNLVSGSQSVIGGGASNVVAGNLAVVVGGFDNQASGNYSFVGGGQRNVASGNHSVALGYFADTNGQDGSFVFADGSLGSPVQSTTANEFVVRASGGTVFYTNSSLTSGASLFAGAGAWASISDVNKKEHFTKVNKEEILHKISKLDISEWNYKSQAEQIRHVGPMAQDFYEAFQLGNNNTTITTTDIDGINMLGIQALAEQAAIQSEKINQLEEKLEALLLENKQLESQLAEEKTAKSNLESLERRLKVLEEKNN